MGRAFPGRAVGDESRVMCEAVRFTGEAVGSRPRCCRGRRDRRGGASSTVSPPACPRGSQRNRQEWRCGPRRPRAASGRARAPSRFLRPGCAGRAAVHLVRGEAQKLGGGDGGSEMPNTDRVEATRITSGESAAIAPHLVADRQRGDEIPSEAPAAPPPRTRHDARAQVGSCGRCTTAAANAIRSWERGADSGTGRRPP